MARYEEVQAAQIREGEHRGAANRLRTEHKEVGSGPGAGSAEVGADGGPTPAGSGESFPASFDRMVAFFRRSKGVFQQADHFKLELLFAAARQVVDLLSSVIFVIAFATIELVWLA